MSVFVSSKSQIAKSSYLKATCFVCLSSILSTLMPSEASALFGGSSISGFATRTNQTRQIENERTIIRRLETIIDEIDEADENNREYLESNTEQVRLTGNLIVEALRQFSGENSSYMDKQIEASRRISDAEQQNAVQRVRDEFRARAESGEFDPASDICLLAGLFDSGGTSGGDQMGTTTSSTAAALNSGGDPAVSQGETVLAVSRLAKRRETQNLLGVQDPVADPAAFLALPTIPDTAENREALVELNRSLIDPFPGLPLNPVANPDPAIVQAAYNDTIRDTRNNASREVISMIQNMKTEVQPITEEGFQAYHDDIASYNRPWPGVGGLISEIQAIDIRTLRQYAPSEEMVTRRSSRSEKGLLQELLDQIAINNRLQYLALELDTRRAIVETQILSALNNPGF